MVERIGKYEVVSEIGKGGFGHVFKAYDKDVRRHVAIKVLNSVDDKEIVRRFSEEAAVVGRLNHKNIVTLYESGLFNGLPFLVMELLEGEDLKDALEARHQFSLLEKVRILCQVAEGLNSAHSAGIVHRDVKPANIMLLKDGTVKIMDFGISRLMSADATHTKTGMLEGTIAYMSPEQFTGRSRVTRLSDIWSYGVIAYELISGVNPFFARIPGQIIFKVTAEDPRPLHEQVPDCPEALEPIIARCLNKEPQLRYSTLDDVRIDLEPILFELERAEADSLVLQARQKLAAKDLPEADRLLKAAIELDRTNSNARALRSELQQQIWNQNIHARIGELRNKAADEIANRRFAEGVRLLEDAVKLDRNDRDLCAELDHAQKTLENSRKALQLFAEGRQCHQQGNLTQADQLVSGAVELDPGLPDARHTLDVIRHDQQERETERKLKQGIIAATDLLSERKLPEAIACLAELSRQFPESVMVQGLLAQANADQAAVEQKQRFRVRLQQAGVLMNAGKYAEAFAIAEPLQAEAPGNPEVRALLDKLRTRKQQEDTERAIVSVVSEVDALAGAGSYDAAIEVVRKGMRSYPGEERLTRKLADCTTARTAQTRERARREAMDLRAAGRLEEASKKVEAALVELGFDTNLSSLQEQIRAESAERQRGEELERALSRAAGCAASGQLQLAVQILQKAQAEFPGEARVADELSKAEQVLRREEHERIVAERVSFAMDRDKRGDPAGALKIAEEVLRMAPGHPALLQLQARLKERVQQNEQSRRRQQLREAVEESLEARKLDEAAGLLQSALREFPGDPDFDSLRAILKTYRDQLELDVIVNEARKLLGSPDLESAGKAIAAGLKRFPGNDRLRFLEHDWRQEIARRNSLAQAEEALEERRLEDAEQLLRALLVSRPDDPDALMLLEQTKSLRLDWSHREKRQKFVADRLAIAAEREQRSEWSGALKVIEDALKQEPGSPELQEKAKALRTKVRESERFVRRQELRSTVEGGVAERNWDKAVKALDEADKQFPKDAGFIELRKFVEVEKADFECNEEAKIIQRLITEGSLDSAGKRMPAALKRFPKDRRMLQLQADLKDAVEWDQTLTAARTAVDAGDWKEAEQCAHVLLSRRPESAAALRLRELIEQNKKRIVSKRLAEEDVAQREAARKAKEAAAARQAEAFQDASQRKWLRFVIPAVGVLMAGTLLFFALHDSKPKQVPAVETPAATQSPAVRPELEQKKPVVQKTAPPMINTKPPVTPGPKAATPPEPAKQGTPLTEVSSSSKIVVEPTPEVPTSAVPAASGGPVAPNVHVPRPAPTAEELATYNVTQVIRWSGVMNPGAELRISPERRLSGSGMPNGLGELNMKFKFPPIPLKVSVEDGAAVSVIAPSPANDFHIIIRNPGPRPVQSFAIRWTQ